MQMSQRTLNVLFVLVGVGGLLLKGHYPGPAHDLVHGYGGNIAASFSVYFLGRNVAAGSGFPRVLAAGLALLAVQSFEVLDGFGLMQNTYDPFDLVANAAGVAIAAAVDTVVGPRATRSES